MQFGREHPDTPDTGIDPSFQIPPAPVDLSTALADNAAVRPRAIAFREIDGSGAQLAELDWLGCWRATRAMAAALQAALKQGDRVLIPQGSAIAFATFLLASMEAGMTAVPVAHPRHPRRMDALLAVARDCGAAAALVEPGQHALFAGGLAAQGVLLIEPGQPLADEWPTAPGRAAPALLQYTSGSTSRPKGVIIGRGGIAANAAAIAEALAVTEQSRFLSWLPLFHDMGLVTSIAVPVATGAESILMPARAFSRDPGLWLDLIGRHRVTHAGGPDFGFNLCARRVSDERVQALDLRSWRSAFLGAEPIREETLARFAARFAAAGFDPAAFQPCYGLAESTLMATAARAGTGATVRAFARDALARGDARPPAAGEAARRLVSCGRAPAPSRLIIAAPDGSAALGPGQVGEIRLAGPSVGAGYWGLPAESAETFEGKIDGRRFLRTGDLGFVDGGELFVSGRIKETLILRGRTCQPHDVEAAASEAHPDLDRGEVAAFAIDLPAREGLALACAVRRTALRGFDAAAMVAAIRRASVRAVQADPDAVLLVRPATLPRTSSGKLRRGACAELLDAPEAALHLWRNHDCAAGGPELGPRASVAEIRRWIVHRLAGRLEVAPADLACDLPFEEIGLDSMGSVELAIALELALDRPVEDVVMWSSPTIDSLALALAQGPPQQPARTRPPASDIVQRLRAEIAGMAP